MVTISEGNIVAPLMISLENDDGSIVPMQR